MSEDNAEPQATILINSKDRKEELGKAVASALQQVGPIEVLVVDDGSSDGTTEYIRKRFPAARVERLGKSRGVIGSRNYGVSIASAPIVFITDDDCLFSHNDIVMHVVREFDHPRVGIVASPYRDIYRDDNQIHQIAPDSKCFWITAAYRGCAHAVRAEPFKLTGGYESNFIRQGEEAMLIQRMLELGYVVKLGTAAPMEHYESPNRNKGKILFHAGRNNCLSVFLATPLIVLPVHLGGTILNSIRAGYKKGYLHRSLQGIFAGCWVGMIRLNDRRSLSWPVYRLYRKLRRRSEPVDYEEVAGYLPSLEAW